MKTFITQISAYSKRTRAGELECTMRIVERITGNLEGDKWEQAVRIRGKIRQLLNRLNPEPEPKRGPYSGLTRRELALTQTCEPDWF